MGQFQLLLIEIQDSEGRVKYVSSEKKTNSINIHPLSLYAHFMEGL